MVRGCPACVVPRDDSNREPSRPRVYLRRRNRMADGSSSAISNEQDSALPEIFTLPFTCHKTYVRRKLKICDCLFCSLSREHPSVLGPRENEASGVSLTMKDKSVLDCPICIEPLSSPIFQCENGHIVCSPCSIQISKTCSYCRLPTGTIRCRALEQLLTENLTFSCAYMRRGCKAKFLHSEREDHEKACRYAPSC